MAIEIIKQGQTKFTKICPDCGCEFTYELDDLVGNIINCPCCKRIIFHKKSETIYPYSPIGVKDILTPFDSTKLTSDPCENCEWHQKMLTSKEPYIGDSPCQWCQHYPYKITCESIKQCK